MKLVVFLSIFFLVITSAKSEDIIDVVYLKDSTVVRGQIFEQIPNESIQIKDIMGKILKINFDAISKIAKEKYTKISLMKYDYIEFGGSFVTPALLNFNFVKWFSEYGFGLSGMYWGAVKGLQCNLKRKLSDNEDRSHGLSIIAGILNITTKGHTEPALFDKTYTKSLDWQYIGLTYNLNYSGFWLEIGFTVSKMNLEPPDDKSKLQGISIQPATQIGYVYRFIK